MGVDRFSRPAQIAKFDPTGIDDLLKVPHLLQQQEDETLDATRDWLTEMYNTSSTDTDAAGVREARAGFEEELGTISEDIRTKGINRAQTNRLLDFKSKYDQAMAASGTIGGPNVYAAQRDAEKAAFYASGLKDNNYSKTRLDQLWEKRTAGRTAYDSTGNLKSEFEGVNLAKVFEPVKEFNAMKIGKTAGPVGLDGKYDRAGTEVVSDNARQIRGAIDGIYNRYLIEGSDEQVSMIEQGLTLDDIWDRLANAGVARLEMLTDNSAYLEMEALKKKLRAKNVAEEEEETLPPRDLLKTTQGFMIEDNFPRTREEVIEQRRVIKRKVEDGELSSAALREYDAFNKQLFEEYYRKNPGQLRDFKTTYSTGDLGTVIDAYDSIYGDYGFTPEEVSWWSNALSSLNTAGANIWNVLSAKANNPDATEIEKDMQNKAEQFKSYLVENDIDIDEAIRAVTKYTGEKTRLQDQAIASYSGTQGTQTKYMTINVNPDLPAKEQTALTKVVKHGKELIRTGKDSYDIIYASSQEGLDDVKQLELDPLEQEKIKDYLAGHADKTQWQGVSAGSNAPQVKFSANINGVVYQLEAVLSGNYRDNDGMLTPMGAMLDPLKQLGVTATEIAKDAEQNAEYSGYINATSNKVDYSQSEKLKQYISNPTMGRAIGLNSDVEIYQDSTDDKFRIKFRTEVGVVSKEKVLTYGDVLKQSSYDFSNDQELLSFYGEKDQYNNLVNVVLMEHIMESIALKNATEILSNDELSVAFLSGDMSNEKFRAYLGRKMQADMRSSMEQIKVDSKIEMMNILK